MAFQWLINLPLPIREFALFLPVLRFIASEKPETRLSLFGQKWQKEIVSDLDLNFVDFFSPEEKSSLAKRAFDCFIHGGSGSSTGLAWAKRLKIQKRAGLIEGLSTKRILNYGSRQERIFSEMHEAEYNLSLLRPLGLDYHSIHKARYAVGGKKQASETHSKKQRIVIDPSCYSLAPFWSARNFARFIVKLHFLDPSEREYHLLVKNNEKRTFNDLKDELRKTATAELRERIFLETYRDEWDPVFREKVAKADFFLGHSSPGYYLAYLKGVSRLALFHPIRSESPFRWKADFTAPLGNSGESDFFFPDVICGELETCAFQKCLYYDCMAKIEVEWVIDHFRKQIL